MKHNIEVTGDTRKYISVIGQSLRLYWIFIMKRSHDNIRTKSLSIINGEKTYFVIADHKTGKV